MTFKSLTHAQRIAKFGAFRFVPAPVSGNAEAITITDGWNLRNIAKFSVPQLGAIAGRTDISFNKQAGPAFVALWAAWEAAGLLPRVLAFNGAWVPRYKRGRGPKVVNGKPAAPFPGAAQLSNHSWGTAFDINARWNPLGKPPAPMGLPGSVEELVPLAEAHGFYWGGAFKSRPDGMHFEYVG